MKLIDSHCHFDLMEKEGAVISDAIARANAVGVQQFLTVNTSLETFPALIAITERYPQVLTSVGVHPNEDVLVEPTVETLVNLGQHPKVVAVGETGLDYFRSQGDLTWQRERFRRHIQAAQQLKKPLIVHTREAAHDTIAMLQVEGAGRVGGVMHCFSEDETIAEQALALGFYISFSGVVTFKNATALQAVAKIIPLDRLLVETDAPYLAPVPHRGKRNEPAFVVHTAEFIAQLRGESLECIAIATSENFERLFNCK